MPKVLPPVDPNVRLPSNVTAASERADEIHRQAYSQPADPQPQPAPAPAPGDAPAPEPAPQPVPPPAHTPEPSEPPAPPAPQPASPTSPQTPPAPPAEELTADQWRHRYLSMQGRYQQTATALGAMQEQMQEMGDELMRSQQEIERVRGAGPHPGVQPAVPAPTQFLTPEEIQAYGPEFIDVVQRAARASIMPDLQNLQGGMQQAVKQIGQRVQKVTVGSVQQQLDSALPEWRALNVDPRFKAWCNSPDIYSGQVRGRLLNAAFQAADAPRVLAFFKGFLAEEQATGQLPDPQTIEPAPPPRTPAIPLDSLAAPGRPRPANGNNPAAPADKPIFTRNQIAGFYQAVRQGHYSGRDAEKNAMEQSIFLAQREGRVR